MTSRELDTDRWAYSRTALARLALAHEAAYLSDRSAAVVPTKNDAWSHPGETVGLAAELVEQAQEVLTRAVLYERQKGTSWEAIGEQLDGITKQSAHGRYKEAEQEWKASLAEPFYPAPPGRPPEARLHEAALEPTPTGRRLDTWTREHLPRHRDEEHPVTGHLTHLSTPEELVQVLDSIRHLQETDAGPGERAAVIERKAALLERIAVEDGSPEAAQQAEEARAYAAVLRQGAQE